MDLDKGRQRVTVGKFWCWLLSSLFICVVLHFVSFASFAWANVIIVLIIYDTALRLVCHSCFAGAEHHKRVTGAAAREQWDAGMVRNNAHVSGVATVACQLCVRSFSFCLRRVSFLRQGSIFWYCSVILCVCVCAEVEQEQHMAPRKVSTRGHVLFTGVLCVACLLCVRFVCLCLCRVRFCAPAFAG